MSLTTNCNCCATKTPECSLNKTPVNISGIEKYTFALASAVIDQVSVSRNNMANILANHVGFPLALTMVYLSIKFPSEYLIDWDPTLNVLNFRRIVSKESDIINPMIKYSIAKRLLNPDGLIVIVHGNLQTHFDFVGYLSNMNVNSESTMSNCRDYNPPNTLVFENVITCCIEAYTVGQNTVIRKACRDEHNQLIDFIAFKDDPFTQTSNEDIDVEISKEITRLDNNFKINAKQAKEILSQSEDVVYAYERFYNSFAHTEEVSETVDPAKE